MDPVNIEMVYLQQRHMAYGAYVQIQEKGDIIKSQEKWSDKVVFDNLDRKITETLLLVYWQDYCPLAYDIRPAEPVWEPLIDAYA